MLNSQASRRKLCPTSHVSERLQTLEAILREVSSRLHVRLRACACVRVHACVFLCSFKQNLNQHMKGVYLSVASLASLTGNRPSLWYLVSPNLHTGLNFKHGTNSKQKCSMRGDNKANVMSLVKLNSIDC